MCKITTLHNKLCGHETETVVPCEKQSPDDAAPWGRYWHVGEYTERTRYCSNCIETFNETRKMIVATRRSKVRKSCFELPPGDSSRSSESVQNSGKESAK